MFSDKDNKFNLIIMGGGAAAFAASNTANRLKKRTLMINDSNILPLGGTCVNVGCVPSKVMLHQGQEYYYPTHSQFRAINVKGKADFVEALKETREMVEFFRQKNYGNIIDKQEHVELKEGRARFVDAHTIAVGDETYYGENILISTGASTFVPPIEGMGDIDYLTNVSVFDLREQPKSLVIFGGGAIAMEFSQIFNHFGIEVTILQRSDRVLSKYDSIIGEELRKHLEAEGIKIYTGVTTKRVKKTNKGVQFEVEIKGKEGLRKIVAEKALLGAGLSAHTNDIDSDNAGVNLTERGFVKVNKYMQTSQKHIWAAGDVTGLMPLETVAAKQGNFAVRNMFEDAKKTINYNEIPSAIFTSPEVAVVGIGEEEYMKKYKTCLCRTVTMDHVEKAGAIKDTRGVIRMVLDHKTNRVIGVHIVAPMAADIITTAVYAIRNKMTIDDIRDTVHVFPTMSEMIKKVAQSFTQSLDDMACCVE